MFLLEEDPIAGLSTDVAEDIAAGSGLLEIVAFYAALSDVGSENYLFQIVENKLSLILSLLSRT